jgi:hypothetical protein
MTMNLGKCGQAFTLSPKQPPAFLSIRSGEPPSTGQLQARGGQPEKVRGRNRITGNLNVRSRPLAPPQHPPRIAIAGDVPRGAASRHVVWSSGSATAFGSEHLGWQKTETVPGRILGRGRSENAG